MFEGIISSVAKSIASNLSKTIFQKIWLKLKEHNMRKKMQDKILYDIIEKCGNQIYYDSLDNFLTKEYFIEQLVSYCFSPSYSSIDSINTYLSYIMKKYVTTYPKYRIYEFNIYQVLYALSKITFETINDYSTDKTARLIITQLSDNIGEKYNTLLKQNKEIIEKLDSFLLTNQNDLDNIDFDDLDRIKLYKTSMVTSFIFERPYLARNIYTNEDDAQTSISKLFEEKRIILLGNPGCGKTYEAMNVFRGICSNDFYPKQIPIFIKLIEYGISFKSLNEIIKKHLCAYFGNVSDKQLNEILSTDRLVLVLDGIDEIQDATYRIKFFSDINHMLSSTNAYYFITSRTTPYHGNINNIKEYHLADLTHEQIREELINNGLAPSLARQYDDLFTNPLFLQLGLNVLKKHGSGIIYNKSQLFNAYIEEVCYKRDQNKQLSISADKNYFNILMIIGQLAYEYFEKSSLSISEFDEYFSNKSVEYSVNNICDVFRIDVFKIGSTITFSHKQFKEYFAAYYLVKKFDVLNNKKLYESLMEQENWQEVIVFAAGLLSDIEQQNAFLDMVLKCNLKTYVICVRYKNDLSHQYSGYSYEEYANKYLETLYNSYQMILEVYFQNIKFLFEPSVGVEPKLLENKKICVVGNFSKNREHLHYWFDWKNIEEDTIQILYDGESSAAYRDMEKRAIIERRNIVTRSINFRRNDLTEDSARQVAINIIYNNLKSFIDKLSFIDNDYILYEKLYSIIHNEKKLKDKSIKELAQWSKEYVEKTYQDFEANSPGGVLAGIHYNRIDVINLKNIACHLDNNNGTHESLSLPQPDLPLKSGWVWSVYSNERVIERVKKFFLWRQTTFSEMVESNFPKMKDYFPLFKDSPYKYRIHLKFKDTDDYTSAPSITYYRVSIRNTESNEPEIITTEPFPEHWDDKIFNIISESYHSNGKEVGNATVTSTSFDMTLTSHNISGNMPLTSIVYSDLKDSFKNLFE